MRLIVLSHEPFRGKMRKHYCMDQFSKDGFSVSFWCIQKLLKYSSKSEYLIQERSEDVVYFNDEHDFIQEFQKLASDTILCVEIWFNWDSLKIFKMITDKKLKFFRIDHYRNQPVSTSQKQKLVRSIINGDFKKIVAAIKTKTSTKLFSLFTRKQNIWPSPLTFIPGRRSEAEFSNPKNKVISITHFDYESYEEFGNTDSLITNKYIVFLDVFLPYHPDIARLGSSSISAKKYFFSLNTLFEALELETGYKVIIAAHPKAKYTNEFNGRICISDATARLVMHAEAVLSHHSTAINFAVLSNKKIGLLYSNAFIDATYENYVLRSVYDSMKAYQNVLNCTMIDMDQAFSFESLKDPDKGLYKEFIENFLLAGDFPKTNYEIIAQGLAIK